MKENYVKDIFELESKGILGLLKQEFHFSFDDELFTDENIHTINTNLHLVDDENFAYKVHKNLVLISLRKLIQQNFPELAQNIIDLLEIDNNLTNEDYVKEISNLSFEIADVENFHINFLNSIYSLGSNGLNRKKSKHYLKERGAVYTRPEISLEIIRKSIESAVEDKPFNESFRCLDFASGTGRFYLEALVYLSQNYGVGYKELVSNNLFAVDIDILAISILRTRVLLKCENLDLYTVEKISRNIQCGNAIYDESDMFSSQVYWLENLKFNLGVNNDELFDVVFSNPPFYLLKVNSKVGSTPFEKNHYDKLRSKIKSEVNFFRNSGRFVHSIQGMLNYYQLSIERMMQIVKRNGSVGIICPSSIFGDLTCSNLRAHILKANRLKAIKYFSESARIFENVSQATVIFYLKKGGRTEEFEISLGDEHFVVDFSLVERLFSSHLEVPLISKVGWSVLEKLTQFSPLKSIGYIRNRRGEFDLTLYSDLITSQNTGFNLIRGRSIGVASNGEEGEEFVNIEEFIKKKSKDYIDYDFRKHRLVCPQISNVDSDVRLKFVIVDENKIIANSCNYICSTRSTEDLHKLQYILNSKLLNWRFKITSSNNHVNNYEIDEFPIIDLDTISLVDLKNQNGALDSVICGLYGLTDVETNYILNS